MWTVYFDIYRPDKTGAMRDNQLASKGERCNHTLLFKFSVPATLEVMHLLGRAGRFGSDMRLD